MICNNFLSLSVYIIKSYILMTFVLTETLFLEELLVYDHEQIKALAPYVRQEILKFIPR